MTETVPANFHPREIELARELQLQGVGPEPKVGDWFIADDRHHVIMRVEQRSGKTFLADEEDNSFALDAVVRLLHRVDCREWLMERDWDLDAQNTTDGGVKAVIRRRNTDFHVERTEPTELAAIYSAMLEIDNLIHFGWA